MKFRLRTLMLLVALWGGLFLACAKWPATEQVEQGVPSTTAPRTFKFAGWSQKTRPPTFPEWSLRAGIGSAILLAAVGMIGACRAWKGKALAANRSGGE